MATELVMAEPLHKRRQRRRPAVIHPSVLLSLWGSFRSCICVMSSGCSCRVVYWVNHCWIGLWTQNLSESQKRPHLECRIQTWFSIYHCIFTLKTKGKSVPWCNFWTTTLPLILFKIVTKWGEAGFSKNWLKSLFLNASNF